MYPLIKKQYQIYSSILNLYKEQKNALDKQDTELLNKITNNLEIAFFEMTEIQNQLKFHLSKLGFSNIKEYVKDNANSLIIDLIAKINSLIKEIKYYHLYNVNLIKGNLERIDSVVQALKSRQITYKPYKNLNSPKQNIVLFNKRA